MTQVQFVPTGAAASLAWPSLRITETDLEIGRSSGCDLRLLHPQIRFRHATVGADAAGIRLRAAAGAYLGTAAEPHQEARLNRLGDSVQIGPFVLAVRDIADNGDMTLSVVQASDMALDEAALARRYFDLYNAGLPNVRLAGLLLAICLILVFFLLPLMSLPGRTIAEPDALAWRHGGAPAAGAQLRLAALWDVGTVSRAHTGFAADCSICHQTPFVPVRSSACVTCHRGIGQHADPSIAPAADLSGRRCETCHHEHKGITMATLDREADCVVCHGGIKKFAPATALPDVLDFGSNHPQFRPALVLDAALRQTKRVEIGDPRAEDHSNVRFTHATHLKLPKLNKAGQQDECAGCHVAAPGGTGFKPVQFDTACASCHMLQFEPQHPEWRLPHGHPEEVASRIAGYYARAALAGEVFARPSTEPFYKPGAPPPQKPPTGTDLVSYETAAAMMSSIARSTCGECHTTSPPGEGQPASAWRVAPVFMPDRYMPASLFSHVQHAASRCDACHAANTSNGGAISLLPGIGTCRGCHTGETGGQTRVASRCVLCHRFHDERLPLALAGAVTELTIVPAKHEMTAREMP